MSSEQLPKNISDRRGPYGLDVDVVWEWAKQSECKP
jgi:hypothetical protein